MLRALSLALLLSVPAAAAEPVDEPAEVQSSEVAPTAVVLTLSDGQTLTGHALRQPDGSVQLTLADGEVLELSASAVATMVPANRQPGAEESRWGPDPNRSRYLYSPTAFPLGQGNGYVAQRALVLTTAAVGVFDFMDFELGAVLPTLFLAEGQVGTTGLKLSARVNDTLRVGGGAQAIFLPADGFMALGFAFGNVTVGTPDKHLSLAGGAAVDFTGGETGAAVATLGGNYRLGPRSALITENWFIWFTQMDGPWNIPLFVVPSGGVRLFGPSFAVDLALVPVIVAESEVPVLPLPWVSFAWNWSLKKGTGR